MRSLTLEYHDVLEESAFDLSGFPGNGPASYKLTPALFAAHLNEIARVEQAVPRRVTDASPSDAAGSIYLTFDDGGTSAHSCIADALEQHDWRGHFFVTAGRVNTPGFMSAAQIRDLHRRGHVIGTHSYSHPRMMGACAPADVFREWSTSIRVLEDILGDAVIVGSVPGGYYKRHVARAAARAGLRVLFTSVPTTRSRVVDGCVILGRYSLRRWTTAAAAAALATGTWRPRFSQWAVYQTSWVLRTILGNNYTRARDLFWRYVT
jgi:peptidoglycan/xylan/chitin deacetylase (PgdA/CDA1 family)